MKKSVHKWLGVTLFGFSSLSFALPTTQTIADNYIGSNAHGWGDVIGDRNIFDIDHLDVSFDFDLLKVKVVTKFKEDPSAWFRNIHYGDLFISTDGWHPHGAAPYTQDRYGNGETWEIVVDTSEQISYDRFGILLTQQVNNGGTFRNGQEVLRNPRAPSHARTYVPVQIRNETINGQLWNTLTYSMSMSALGIEAGDELGFKWSMTCGNDSIEGVAAVPSHPDQVPEPTALALLGIGLIGLTSVRRKRASAEA
jgi:hypothetical protein